MLEILSENELFKLIILMGCAESQSSKGGEKEILSDDELLTVGRLWSTLREKSADSGLFIFQRFFDQYPQEVERFAFTKDQFGNISPNFMKSEAMREHSIKVMQALDSIMTQLFKRDPKLAKHIYDTGYSHYAKGINEEEMTMLGNSIVSAIHSVLGAGATQEELAPWQKIKNVIGDNFKRGFRQAEEDGLPRF